MIKLFIYKAVRWFYTNQERSGAAAGLTVYNPLLTNNVEISQFLLSNLVGQGIGNSSYLNVLLVTFSKGQVCQFSSNFRKNI
jgi:hypothetical protein